MDSGTQSTQSNIWITGFSPDGYKVSLTLTITSVADALRCIQEVRACGITPYAPEAKPGEVRETVDVCVYRVYTGNDGKEKFVVDVYRERAQYRTLSIYFDNDADVTAFENQAGRSIDEFKVYNSQAPLQRNIDRPTKHELNVRPFEIIKSPDKEKEIGGVMRMVYRFGGYANPLTVSPTMSKDDRKPAANANGQQQTQPPAWYDDKENIKKLVERANKRNPAIENANDLVEWVGVAFDYYDTGKDYARAIDNAPIDDASIPF